MFASRLLYCMNAVMMQSPADKEGVYVQTDHARSVYRTLFYVKSGETAKPPFLMFNKSYGTIFHAAAFELVPRLVLPHCEAETLFVLHPINPTV